MCVFTELLLAESFKYKRLDVDAAL